MCFVNSLKERWKTKTNRGVEDLRERKDTVQFIKIRLEWVRHMKRMENGRPKKLTCGNVHRVRERQEQRKRYNVGELF